MDRKLATGADPGGPAAGEPGARTEGAGDRPAGRWAWAVILLAPLILVAAQALIPEAESEAAAQHDRSLLGLLQVQAQAVIALHAVEPEAAAIQLESLESHATGDATTAGLAALHAFLHWDDGGRDAALRLLRRRGEQPEADTAFLRQAEEAMLQGVSEAGRESMERRLGWFAGLLGEAGSPESVPRREAIRSAAVKFLALAGVFSFAAFAGLLAGAGLLLFAIIRSKQGRLSLAFRPGPPGSGGVYLESFALFLGGMVAGNLGGWLIHWTVQPAASLLGLALALRWPVSQGVSWRQARLAMGWHRGRGFWREVGAGAAGYLAVLPMAVIGLSVTVLLGVAADHFAAGGEEGAVASPPVTHPAVGWLLEGWQAKVLVFFLAAVLAPLVEEAFFRGAFYRGLRPRLGMVAAGLGNGLIFAALHPQGWLAIPALTAMGLGFSCIREWRDSLVAPVTAHAINNGLLVGGLSLVLR